MRSFQSPATIDPVPGEVVALLRRIDLAAGAEARFRDQLPQLLDSLRQQARVESVTASSAIEGIVVDPSRAPGLVSGRTERFRDRSEAEFADYSAALDHLHQGKPGELSVGLILHLHRLLFSHTEARGGSFKADDNIVVERDAGGQRRIRFEPVSARETPWYTEELVVRTNEATTTGLHHPLLVTAAFVLDLLCIHPFSDGNGRVGRLATTYLLDRAGYGIGRYVSIEQLIYETSDEYYEALARSTRGWFDDGSHDLWPWAGYLLERVAEAYDRFEARAASGTGGGTKQERVRDFVLLHAPATFRIGDVRRAVPGVSDNTIRLVLAQLRGAGEIANDGPGRSATWHHLQR